MHGKDQSILAIGKEVVMQPSTLFLLGVKTHFSITTYSSPHVSRFVKSSFVVSGTWLKFETCLLQIL
jgi:hypothetical protein